jgi:hypothetical protein
MALTIAILPSLEKVFLMIGESLFKNYMNKYRVHPLFAKIRPRSEGRRSSSCVRSSRKAQTSFLSRH